MRTGIDAWIGGGPESVRAATLELALIAGALLAPPLAGVWIAAQPLHPYLELPGGPRAAVATEFSPVHFVGLAVFVVAVLTIIAWLIVRGRGAPKPGILGTFPWWGGLGAAMVITFWTLAWSRFEWFEPWQRHTFTPLWVGYILLIAALCHRRTGSCLLSRAPVRFLALFPLSALFWWFFEYLNRFVQNWHYVGVDSLSGFEYALFASVSFSTVLPAVLSTAEWLGSFGRVERAFAGLKAVQFSPRSASGVLLVTSGSLVALPLWPQHLYPLVWLSPLLVTAAIQHLRSHSAVLDRLAVGDWGPIFVPALAALMCGFFWELWNSRSLAHWEYTVPFVDRFHLFEMPILGYAGYLPFGVECIIAAGLLPRPRGS